MREIGRAILEALLVAVASVALGFGANAVNENGLKISRDYFERLRPADSVARATAPATAPDTTPGESATQRAEPAPTEPVNAARARLQEYGIGVVHLEHVKSLLEDPLFNSAKILIDARNDERYQEGHIPGAHQFDHYYPDRYLPNLLPLLFPAEEIVIYCAGGECEDSEHAAVYLIQQGISREKIRVYLEGYKEWTAKGQPVEKGERGSGNIAPGAPQ